jgi:DNA repair protein RecO
MQGWTTEAIVLKRVNVGEGDRIITLLTPDNGKVVCVAKGIRKMTSSQRAFLEPGSHISTHFRSTRSLPIITQSQLIDQFTQAKSHLQRMKQVFEILELADLLFVENNEDVEGFEMILDALKKLNQPKVSITEIQAQLNELFMHLGYQDWKETQYTSILEYAASVAERPLRSYDFLSVHKTDVVK